MYKEIVIIGGGLSGLSVLFNTLKKTSSVILIEKEENIGGIFSKNDIKNTFNESDNSLNKLIQFAKKNNDSLMTSSFVTKIEKNKNNFITSIITKDGIKTIASKIVILATGSYESPVTIEHIYGDRPSGIFSYGEAQYYLYHIKKPIARNCLIYLCRKSTTDIIEKMISLGTEVKGIVIKSESFINDDIIKIKDKYGISIFKNYSVSSVFGKNRLEKITIVKNDKSDEKTVLCDGLVVLSKYIQENTLSSKMGVAFSNKYYGPIVDQSYMTSIDGLYSIGNCLIIHDDIKNMIESSAYSISNSFEFDGKDRKLVKINHSPNIEYIVPEVVDICNNLSNIDFYFKASKNIENSILCIKDENKVFIKRKINNIIKDEMIKINFDLSEYDTINISKIEFILEEYI